MKRFHLFLGACAVAALTGRADAQIFLNEIYASHSGSDDQEFVELKGPASTSLDNHMVLIVEGQCTSCGTLDQAWDLSGTSIPGSGYYVLGDTAVTPNDFAIFGTFPAVCSNPAGNPPATNGTCNAIENGTETFYLINAGSPAGVAAVSARKGTDVAWPPSGMNTSTITILSTSTTILDIVGMWDGDNFDVPAFDGANAFGPDGPFFPAGIFRDQDAPSAWCDANWLDFDDGGNVDRPRTPGTANSPCVPGGIFSSSFCDASDNALANCPCTNPGDDDTGCDSPIPAMQGGGTTGGIKLTMDVQQTTPLNRVTCTGSGYPSGSTPTAILIRDESQEATPVVFGDGIRCVGVVNLVRLAATIANGGTSTHTFGHGTMAGVGTFYYQLWFRSTPITYCDPGAAFNLSNGQTLDW